VLLREDALDLSAGDEASEVVRRRARAVVLVATPAWGAQAGRTTQLSRFALGDHEPVLASRAAEANAVVGEAQRAGVQAPHLAVRGVRLLQDALLHEHREHDIPDL
jgi:hypothetical protein